MIKVSPRARRHDDRAGDPLDGLVNLFDIGIVLAVAFLLAALSSLNLTAVDRPQRATRPNNAITVPPGGAVHTVPRQRTEHRGRRDEGRHGVPTRDGRLIYVVSPSPSPSK